jgi:tetratricopeptide (TPR) repeat protein
MWNDIWNWLLIEENRQILSFLGGGLVVVVGGLWIAYTYFRKSAKDSSPTSASITTDKIQSGGDTLVGSGRIDKQTVGTQYNADIINVGVPFEQYKADLAEKEIEIRQLLVNAATSEKDKEILSIELAEVERKRGDEQESYKTHVKNLEGRINRLDRLRGQLPEKLINEAKQTLAVGDNSNAEQLFIQVEEQADPHISAAADEAAYQRGKLSEEAISYSEAIKHYQRATRLTPDNNEYLNAAGVMLYILGKYQKAIGYRGLLFRRLIEQAVSTHPVTETDLTSGDAWR